MSRKHFNKTILVSHVSPNGNTIIGDRDKLHKKFLKGTITKEELHKYVSFLLLEKKKKPFVNITIWGKVITLTLSEYENHAINLNLK